MPINSFSAQREHKLLFLSYTRESNKRTRKVEGRVVSQKGDLPTKKLNFGTPKHDSSKALKPIMAASISLPMRQKRKTKK